MRTTKSYFSFDDKASATSITTQNLITGIVVATSLVAAPAGAQEKPPGDIVEMSLEELASIEVTSVSKRPEALSDAPSSVYVITGNEIRRSGVSTLPEALRLAPNLDVARVDARNYAVTARGFNNPFENKLLVLIDGRTVYSPLFSGVFWDAQDVVLEDVERIEVISGPGATMWGANAVNGVINIITKSAAGTPGAMASVSGSKDEKEGAMRYGGDLGNGGRYRVYGKYADNDDTTNAKGASTFTGWHRQQAGFRADWTSPGRNVTFQGDAYDGRLHQGGTRDIKISGANLLGRLNQTLDDGSNVMLQAYWDRTERDQPNAFVERLDTFDIQAQQSVNASDSHHVVWGGGYRLARDHVRNGPVFAFLPGNLNLHWSNLFVQDEIALQDNVRATVGLKVEDNNYTGAEWLPTLRLSWKPHQKSMVWTSLSRSVRAPSRIDRDFYAPSTPTIVNGSPQYAIAGGPDFESEIANVLELGYRAQPTATLSYSSTIFYGKYDKLRTFEPNPNGSGSVFLNRADGQARGIEMWGTWQASPQWRLATGVVVQRVDTKLDPGSKDATGTTGLATSDPSHYWSVKSFYDVGSGQEFDVTIRHAGALPRPSVPAYTAVDFRYGWKLNRNLDLSLVGRNLFDPRHAEYGSAAGRSEYDRAVLIKLVWRD